MTTKGKSTTTVHAHRDRLDKLRALSPEQLEAKIREAEPIWREADRQASGFFSVLAAMDDADDLKQGKDG